MSKSNKVFELIDAIDRMIIECEHVKDNLTNESKEVWEVEINCLETAIKTGNSAIE